MKNVNIILIVFLLLSCKESVDNKDNVTGEESAQYIPYAKETGNRDPSSQQPAPVQAKAKKVIPKYKIVRQNTTYCDYSVLISAVNLNNLNYKDSVKAIVDDLARKSGSTVFQLWVFDSKEAEALNYLDLEKGVRLTKAQNKFVNNHWVAEFGKDIDGEVRIGYFINVPAEERKQHVAWEGAFNEVDFENGYTPQMN